MPTRLHGAGEKPVSEELQGMDVGVGVGRVIPEPLVELGKGITPVEALPDIQAPHVYLAGIGGRYLQGQIEPGLIRLHDSDRVFRF